MTERPAIRAEGIEKYFGETHALRGLDLEVAKGTILGVLGPNGAGKTTAVRILSTLLEPDAGHAEVNGFDVVRNADDVRRCVGLTGQYAAVDEYLTGVENLEMFGRLYHLPKVFVKKRTEQLLEQFDLVEAANRPAKTYSGGMRRRLDLAAGLLASPPVLFLDEPTTGLDPRSRLGMWEIIKQLVASGTTLLLTTQYLEEADQLANQIVVIDKGRAIAKGTADELKLQVGGARLELTVAEGSSMDDAERVLEAHGTDAPQVDPGRRHLLVPAAERPGLLAAVIRDLDGAGVRVDDFGLRRPTLDDVFLTLTGHTTEDDEEEEKAEKETTDEKSLGKKKKRKTAK